jgi:hypothetical protein
MNDSSNKYLPEDAIKDILDKTYDQALGHCLTILSSNVNLHPPVIEYFNKCYEQIEKLKTNTTNSKSKP